MKLFFKGCLITLGVFVLAIVIGVIYIIYPMTRPNEVEFSTDPFSDNKITNLINFEGQSIPKVILNRTENEILYQAIIEETSLDKSTIYKVLFRIDSNIQFDNKFPLNSDEIEKLNDNIKYIRINNDQLNAKLSIPKNQETESGNVTSIYSKQGEVDFILNLQNGSHKTQIHSIDKVGMVSDVLIYDKSKSYLYYERLKYDAFQ